MWTTYTDAPIKECDTTNGITFEIETSDTGTNGDMDVYTTYQPELYIPMRVVYTSTSSLLADDEGRVAIDYFTVHFREDCFDLSIVLTAGFDNVDYRVHTNSG